MSLEPFVEVYCKVYRIWNSASYWEGNLDGCVLKYVCSHVVCEDVFFFRCLVHAHANLCPRV